MLPVKRLKLQSHSPNKLEANICISCKEPVQSGDDVFECVWCGKMQHGTCHKISSDQCSALCSVSENLLYFVLHACISYLVHYWLMKILMKHVLLWRNQ